MLRPWSDCEYLTIQRAGLTAYTQVVAPVVGILVALTTRTGLLPPGLHRDALVAGFALDGPGAGRRRLGAGPPEEARLGQGERRHQGMTKTPLPMQKGGGAF